MITVVFKLKRESYTIDSITLPYYINKLQMKSINIEYTGANGCGIVERCK